MKLYLEYLAVRTAIAVVRLLPGAAVDAFGSWLGFMAYAADAPHRQIAARNVEAAFPALSSRERGAIVRGAFRHFGRLLLQLLKFSTLSPEQMLERVEFEGEEEVRAAFARGRG